MLQDVHGTGAARVRGVDSGRECDHRPGLGASPDQAADGFGTLTTKHDKAGGLWSSI